jgi:hypothetical protein
MDLLHADKAMIASKESHDAKGIHGAFFGLALYDLFRFFFF